MVKSTVYKPFSWFLKRPDWQIKWRFDRDNYSVSFRSLMVALISTVIILSAWMKYWF